MQFVDTVRSAVGGPIDDLCVLDEVDPLDFSTLQRAVVVFHATWSCPSVMVVREYVNAYRRMTESLNSRVEFYILNLDRLTDAYIDKLPGIFGGNGETFLVISGEIIKNIPRFSDSFENEIATAFGVPPV